MLTPKHKFIAKTLHNLEEVLANELKALGAEQIEIGRRAVSFEGDKSMLYKANLRLRTALRILKPIHSFKAKDADELYAELVKFSWDKVMRIDQSFSIDTTVFSDSFTHSKYVGYRAKDALVDYWRKHSGKRPNVSLDAPDIYLNIHIAQNEVTLSLDSSGESLHKRGYRTLQTDAPINEVLAAGILLKAGWDGSCDLIDPMCGSGTFLIEAALIARNIAPGIYRENFAFEQWLDYDAELFQKLYDDDSQERAFEYKIYGGDILAHAIRVSDNNVRRAGVSRYVKLDIIPFEERPTPDKPALIVMNPPYGERLKLSSAKDMYAMIGERLKHNYVGSSAWIIAYKPEHFDSVGLKHSSRTEMMNGSLSCELRSYELFAGKREDFKKKPKEREQDKRSERKAFFSNNPQKRASFAEHRRTASNKSSRQEQTYDKEKRRFKEGHTERTPKNFVCDSQSRNDKKLRRKLWPSDRFNYRDAEGNLRRRKSPNTNIQVFRSEDK